jgi:mannosyltransferase
VVPAVTAFAVGGYQVARPSLWRDEAYTIDAASRSVTQILALLRHQDAVHGAYYLCMHVVITLFGRSETAVRLPSVVATAVAAGCVAVLGRRLATAQGAASPQLTGLLAGLLYAAVPAVTRYAQEARSYATVTAIAVIASYLLVRALGAGRRRWWAGYAAAIALIGLFNLFGLLIVAAHAATVLVASARAGRAPGRAGVRSWAVAVLVAAIIAGPVLALGYRQRGATSWMVRPGWPQVSRLMASLAGSAELRVALLVLVAFAVVAWLTTARPGPAASAPAASAPVASGAVASGAGGSGAGGSGAGGSGADDRTWPLDIIMVALPWLVLPSVILLGVAQLHPVYNFRYVVFCLPAVALLAADGLSRLAGFTARHVPASAGPAAAWLPSLALAALLVVAVSPAQRAVRLPWSRVDNLRRASAIIGARARAGDAVLYVDANARAVSLGYPAPFRRLADIALARSPVATATLLGTEVGPAVLASRFATVARVWVIGVSGARLPPPENATDRRKLALISRLREADSWRANSDLLSLYVRPLVSR